MEMVRPMTQRFDPRTGKMVGGVGTGMLDAGSTLINREEVGKTAAAQAQRQQLYNQQLMQMYKQMMGGGQDQQVPARPTSQLGGGAGWGFGLGGQQWGGNEAGLGDIGGSPRRTPEQVAYERSQGRY